MCVSKLISTVCLSTSLKLHQFALKILLHNINDLKLNNEVKQTFGQHFFYNFLEFHVFCFNEEKNLIFLIKNFQFRDEIACVLGFWLSVNITNNSFFGYSKMRLCEYPPLNPYHLDTS